MEDDRVIRVLNEFKSGQRSGGRALVIACTSAIVILEVLFIAALSVTAVERANIAASVFTGNAILLAAWQWWAQRRETTLEAYFTRLDVPNQRRLSFYEQLVALGSEIGNEALGAALHQFYVFYVYAELDNLEYAMTKYMNDSISGRLAERAAKTFVSRCEQSGDFRRIVCVAVQESGYPAAYERLVHQLAGCADPDAGAGDEESHPMQFNELEIVRQIKEKK